MKTSLTLPPKGEPFTSPGLLKLQTPQYSFGEGAVATKIEETSELPTATVTLVGSSKPITISNTPAAMEKLMREIERAEAKYNDTDGENGAELIKLYAQATRMRDEEPFQNN